MNNETLRKKFFEECTDKSGPFPKINRMPHDVFKWIEENCLKDEWISVDVERPKSGFSCLISDGNIVCQSFYGHDGEFYQYKGVDGRNIFDRFKKPLFWMPIPNAKLLTTIKYLK